MDAAIRPSPTDVSFQRIRVREKTIRPRTGNKTGPGKFCSSWNKIKRQTKWSTKMRDGDRQQRSSSFALTHLALLLVILMAVGVRAQTSTTGDIAGVVTDP